MRDVPRDSRRKPAGVMEPRKAPQKKETNKKHKLDSEQRDPRGLGNPVPSAPATEGTTKKEKLKFLVSLFCGATENRTRDTRIFSPLLYQLSYGTIISFGITKVGIFLDYANFPTTFFYFFGIFNFIPGLILVEIPLNVIISLALTPGYDFAMLYRVSPFFTTYIV